MRFILLILVIVATSLVSMGQSLIVPQWMKLIDEGYAEAPSEDYRVVLLFMGTLVHENSTPEKVEQALKSEAFLKASEEYKIIVKRVEYDNNVTRNLFMADRTFQARWPSWRAYDRHYQTIAVQTGWSTAGSMGRTVLSALRLDIDKNNYLTEHRERKGLDSAQLLNVVEDYYRKNMTIPEVFVRKLLANITDDDKLTEEQVRLIIKLAPDLSTWQYNVIYSEKNFELYKKIFVEEFSYDQRRRVNQERINKSTQRALDTRDVYSAKIIAEFLESTHDNSENAKLYMHKYLMEFGIFLEDLDLYMENLIPYAENNYFNRDIDTLRSEYERNLQSHLERLPPSAIKIPASQLMGVFGMGSYTFYWAEHIYLLSNPEHKEYLAFALKLVDFSLAISREGFNLNLKSKILHKLGDISKAKELAKEAVERAKETDDFELVIFQKWLNEIDS